VVPLARLRADAGGVMSTAARKMKSRPRTALQADTLTEQAYNRLEEMIVTLALAPGAVLSEQALCSELGIGRTPIREALQRLAREGLVLVLPRKAIIVTQADPRRQLLVLEVRRPLERLLAGASAERASAAERARFDAIAKGMEAAARSSDDLAFMRLDRALNALLAEAAHNEYASRAMRMLNGHSRRFWYLHYRQAADLPKIARLHADQARAIADGSAECAMALSDKLIDYVEGFTRATLAIGVAPQ
jgi:DNA-binding GntR family transcriptional regulator